MTLATTSVMSNNTSDTNETKNTSVSAKTDSFPGVKEEKVSYELDGKKYDGYVSYKEDQKGKRPGILVVHEWWGLNDYSRRRAKQLAEMGYIAMAVDVYGNGQTAEDPASAEALATPFYKDPALAKKRLDAAINFLKTYPETDSSKMAAIGYCFGGYVALNAAKLGADLKGVVSFHGGLTGAKPQKNVMHAKILVCHGANDQLENAHVEEFKKEMDSAGADYTFKVYPDASHAYSNPAATAKGEKYNMPIKYNAAADAASWNDMKKFFKTLFHD